ncbi:hypothetical protein LOAG_13433, partial [Loa loa]
MPSERIMMSANDSTNDNSNQSTDDIVVIQQQIEINEHPSIEATTMMKLITKSAENGSDKQNEVLNEMNKKCIL